MPSLFNEKTLRKLDRLALVASQVRAGQIKGERRSTKRGTSIEFADYRDYVRGDDLRRVDWNVYARLERPFIKLLEEEEDLAVHLLLDASRSMDFGADEQHKFRYAQRLAAALGHIALAAGDRLTLSALPSPDGRAGHEAKQFGPARGGGHTLGLLQFLDGLRAEGTTELDAALRAYALGARRAGLAFLISDLFSPSGYRNGLSDLQGRGYEVSVLHLLAPDELDPPLAGDLRLIDAETGSPQDVTLDGGLRELYRKRVAAWRDEIEAYCLKRGIHYVPVTTDVAWDELVLFHLRRRGLIK
ncbi:MAG: DUF58 domain-containing protein [Anaerolineales bacterium]